MKKIVKRECLGKIKPYVPGKPTEEVERELGIKVSAKLASNENALGPSPLAVKAAVDALANLHRYPDGSCHHLRKALAGRLDLNPGQLLFANGSDESIGLIARTYINPGDEGIIPAPSFPQYEFVLKVMGGIPRVVPLNEDFTYDLDAVLHAITERTRLIFICSPNNPTGTVLLRTELDRFLEALPEGIMVVIDEAYLEYVTADGYFDSLDYIRKGLPVISLRTFSKIYGLAGLRIGYAVAAEQYIRDISVVCEPFHVNSLAQAAAAAVLDDDQYLAGGRKLVASGRVQLEKGLTAMGMKTYPTEANFLFVDFGRDSRKLFEDLLRHGVIIRPGDIYGFPNHARITIGTGEENASLLEILALVTG